jgi:Winged helix DNA-binding domain
VDGGISGARLDGERLARVAHLRLRAPEGLPPGRAARGRPAGADQAARGVRRRLIRHHPAITLRELNRALLARQGLLEPIDAPLVDAVEAVGAVQAQHWPAVPVALWTRVAGFEPAGLFEALERGELVAGSLIRNTLHLVSAREHPAYAAVTAESGADTWQRTKAEPGPEVETLRKELLEYCATPRSGDEIAGFVEAWVGEHPDALDAGEVDHQRKVKWRPFLRWSSLVRVPADGRWGAKAPSALLAAPTGSAKDALEQVVRRHLRAFGPAGAEDVAGWIGWRTPPVRGALERLEGLERLEDEDGRTLYDLPDAPRPDGDADAPPRLLAAFDSALLAYAPKHRARILPPEYRDEVYERANLRIRPSFLVDGLVAGTWSSEVRRREAVVKLKPLRKLARGARAALAEEAERLARAVHPAAKSHGAAFESS